MTESIWCVRRRSYLTCSYIVVRQDGCVLIDAGMDSDGRDMRAGLKVAGDGRDVRAVLLTHWHNDHAAGASATKEETGAKVYYHAAEEPFFTRKTARVGFRGWLGERIPEWGLFVLFKGLLGEASPRPVAADRFVRDGDVVEGDFQVIETPGHTPGHVSWYYRPDQALFAGDALAVVDGRVRFMARPVTPDLETARRSMRRCLELPIRVLCPGHRGPLSDGAGERCRELADYLDRGGAWPLLG